MTRSVRRKVTFAGLGAAGAGALLAFALAGPNAAFADPSPSPSGSASSSASPGRGPGRTEADREARQNELAEQLAKELGIDPAKVKAALDKIEAEQQATAKADRLESLKQRLDQAVKDGKLTQAEADAIYKAAENGVFPGGGFGGPGGHRGGR